MKKETRVIVYDEDLRIETYRFEGIVQAFPNHFHEFYVIGLMQGGNRAMSCKNHEYLLSNGDIVLFNPEDNHGCAPVGDGTLYYCALNIKKDIMLDWTKEITGQSVLPGFSETVVRDTEAAGYLQQLHEFMMNGADRFAKDEMLILLLSRLLQQYGRPFESGTPECSEEIVKACRYMEDKYAEHLDLNELCEITALSKSTLLRAFTKSKGVTPYSYLQNVRIGKARKLLEKGILPIEAALKTGFSDQSHFTNYFSRFLGVAPGVYRQIFQNQKDTEVEVNE